LLATFVIFVREGVEASMIVAILLAYLDRIGQRRHFRDVIVGVFAALLLATGGGLLAYFTIRTYAGSRVQTIFETVTYLLAACVLTYMTFWMRRHSRTISKELREKTERALDGGERFGLAFLAFQAVGREGLETAVFTLAIVFAAGSGGHFAILGGVGGLVVALAIAFVIYRLGRRLNIGRFFSVLGAVLMFFAAGLLADAVENLQQLGWVTLLAHPLWNTSHVLSEDSALGDVFHSLFGYADRPSVLQAIVYVAFLVGGFGASLAMSHSRSEKATSAASHPAAVPGPAKMPASDPAPRPERSAVSAPAPGEGVVTPPGAAPR
jgi:high-affinity iron transporter